MKKLTYQQLKIRDLQIELDTAMSQIGDLRHKLNQWEHEKKQLFNSLRQTRSNVGYLMEIISSKYVISVNLVEERK